MEPSNWLTAIGIFLTTEITLIAAIWGFALWLSRTFTSIYDRIQKTLDLMISKLEYHEEHDDVRFAQVTDSLWALRVEQAKSLKDNSNG